jgi:hypothetical protein
LFYSRSLLKVRSSGAAGFIDSNIRRVSVEDNLEQIDRDCLILASKGWGQGNPETIANMSVSWVLKMLEYQRFTIDHEIEFRALNSK